MQRDYDQLINRIKKGPNRERQMQSFVDVVWDALHNTDISWIGFYQHDSGEELVLGPRRDKPACSPIGLHGACGQSFKARRPVVVHDVKELGENYIACDPRDRSEVVIPLFDESGECWGVLDVDSHEIGAFDEQDVAGLESLLQRAGLTHHQN